MYKFSETSKAKLSTCHRDLQRLFEHIIIERDCTIICGHRSEEDQNKAFADGKSEKQYPNSKHNMSPSLAVDVAPFEKAGIDWGKLQSAEFAGYVKGVADQLYRIGSIKHRIRCGADWDCDYDVDDTKFWDAYHFELIPNP
jgi:peptidoglycan L-alanyl-D-glutamate endopeptidase CwlK